MRLIDADALKETIKKDMYIVDYAVDGAIYGMFWNGIENAIDEQPSAEPERKTGKWIKVHWKAFRCSECNKISEYFTNFCPNCGANMEVQE